MTDYDEVFREAQKALQTTIGTEETYLRKALGNEGYETLKQRADAVADAAVINAYEAAKLTQAQVLYVKAKMGFWNILTCVVTVAALVGIAAFCWWVA